MLNKVDFVRISTEILLRISSILKAQDYQNEFQHMLQRKLQHPYLKTFKDMNNQSGILNS